MKHFHFKIRLDVIGKKNKKLSFLISYCCKPDNQILASVQRYLGWCSIVKSDRMGRFREQRDS
jgi:hypothetical protein